MPKFISDLPSALQSGDELGRRLAGRRIAVFLDYDGTLTPIVERPELAVLSESMRGKLSDLAERCPVAIVSGRDLVDVRGLVGLNNLIYAGSHGFDIAGPNGQEIHCDKGEGFHDLITQIEDRLHRELDPVEGSLIEHKKSSVAVHYRLVGASDRALVKAAVDRILEDHEELRVTPGKMVYEIQPRLDWDKGKAVLWLLEVLGLDGDDVAPVYLGDDVTDEDAFEALAGRGIGVFVGDPSDPEVEHRTSADYIVKDPDEAGLFLQSLAGL